MIEYARGLLKDPWVSKIVISATGVIVINIVVRVLKHWTSGKLKSKHVRYAARRGLTFFGYLASIILLLAVFSKQMGNITVALGVAGAGIAFALQEVIISVAGWIALSFGQFYTIGDRVQLGGIKGDVIDISVLRTTVMEIGEWVKGDQYNGRIVRVANSFVFKEPVFNYSADFPYLWDEIAVPIKYGSDHRMAREIILAAAAKEVGAFVNDSQQKWKRMTRKYAVEHAVVEPTVFLVINDSYIEFTLRYVVDFKKRRIQAVEKTSFLEGNHCVARGQDVI